jgi:hypothetical protein
LTFTVSAHSLATALVWVFPAELRNALSVALTHAGNNSQ